RTASKGGGSGAASWPPRSRRRERRRTTSCCSSPPGTSGPVASTSAGVTAMWATSPGSPGPSSTRPSTTRRFGRTESAFPCDGRGTSTTVTRAHIGPAADDRARRAPPSPGWAADARAITPGFLDTPAGFGALLLAYLVVHLLLRVLVSRVLTIDDAREAVLGQTLAWGYQAPQPS